MDLRRHVNHGFAIIGEMTMLSAALWMAAVICLGAAIVAVARRRLDQPEDAAADSLDAFARLRDSLSPEERKRVALAVQGRIAGR